MNLIDSLDGMVNLDLDSLLHQLEVKLRNAILGMRAPDQCEVTSALIADMRREFSLLVDVETDALNPGQMLLVGFTGLFSRLQVDFSAMLEATAQLQVPDLWKNIDVVKRARSIQMTAFNSRTLDILSDIFFLKQLRAIVEFFALCRQAVSSLQGR